MSTPVRPVEQPGELRREFTLWSSFAFAFAFISPIVALYGIYGLAVSAAGPAFWWGFLIVFLGQLLVALVFAELVSRWPIEGSIYQWATRLLGRRAGWFAGWTYLWTLVIAMATVALGAAGFLAAVIGIDNPSTAQRLVIAFLILAFGTVANIVGRTVLKVLMSASIAAEVIGSVGLGTWLLIAHRQHPISFLFTGNGSAHGGSYLTGPFLVAMAFIGWSFVGFESAGSIAEEVKEPRRNLPKAVIFSLSFIALVVMYSSLAITLAIPDLGAIVAGKDADPVTTTLTTALGSGIARPLELLFVIGFVASFLALQTSASRLLWAYSRDSAMPGSHWLGRLTAHERVPVNAILVTFVVGAVIFLLSAAQGDLYSVLVNFTSGGFYLAFLFALVGNLVARLRGTWTPGPWSLGKAGMVLAVVAPAWALFEALNIAWPRTVFEQWYLNWSFFLVVLGLGIVGGAIYASRSGRMTSVGDDRFGEDGLFLDEVGATS
ncbi:MAG: APC family permease [Actinomycetales bacterium]